MKIEFCMKNPDVVYEAIRDAAKQSVAKTKGLSAEEREELEDSRHEQLEEACKPWIEYGEYITVEIDTVAQTATVVRKN